MFLTARALLKRALVPSACCRWVMLGTQRSTRLRALMNFWQFGVLFLGWSLWKIGFLTEKISQFDDYFIISSLFHSKACFFKKSCPKRAEISKIDETQSTPKARALVLFFQICSARAHGTSTRARVPLPLKLALNTVKMVETRHSSKKAPEARKSGCAIW